MLLGLFLKNIVYCNFVFNVAGYIYIANVEYFLFVWCSLTFDRFETDLKMKQNKPFDVILKNCFFKFTTYFTFLYVLSIIYFNTTMKIF